jgi:tRNA pseudouridine32 synthase/23S rRNA pseudouridine746 synthase
MPLSNIHILHQDAAVLVVNKPTLLLSVPGRADDNKDCLITRLQENGYPEARSSTAWTGKPPASSCWPVTPTPPRTVAPVSRPRNRKAYTALCWGQPELDSGSIDLPLRYDPPTKPRHVVDHEFGKHALTFWRVWNVAATGAASS